MRHGLHYVYRCSAHGDCSANGLSSQVDTGLLFWNCKREEAIAYCQQNNIDPSKQFYLVERELWGENHSYAEPLVKPDQMAQTFGGNFLYTSCSNGYNLGYTKCNVPIPIHDRFDTWEAFEALGR